MADKDYDSDSDAEEQVKQEVEEVPEVVEDVTLTNPDVVTKYQEAAKIAQAALIEIAAKCVVGAKIVDICKFGDELIEARTAAIFNKKGKNGKVPLKGVAFPVCLSVNEAVCHVSPIATDDSYPDLVDGDVVKIDLGVHVDGFIAVVAHTVVVGSSDALSPEQVAARDNVISAAYTAAEVAVRLLKPGHTNHQVTAGIKHVADAFGVNAISGTVMHQMKQFVIDGNKMILLKEEPEQKIDLCTFETGEVYAIDIAMSTGEGRPRETGDRTTVYKRQVDKKYSLKNKSSRQLFNDVNKRFPTMPFSLRSLADETNARLGVRECVNHDLLLAYPVLREKKGDAVAHVKVTVLLLPSGNTAQITGLPPSTYIQAVTQQQESGAEEEADKEKEALKNTLSASLPVGLTLSRAVLSSTDKALPESVVALLSQLPVESKKKAKKSKKTVSAAKA